MLFSLVLRSSLQSLSHLDSASYGPGKCVDTRLINDHNSCRIAYKPSKPMTSSEPVRGEYRIVKVGLVKKVISMQRSNLHHS